MLAGLICMDLKRDVWKTHCFICANTAIAKNRDMNIYIYNSIVLNIVHKNIHQNINQRK